MTNGYRDPEELDGLVESFLQARRGGSRVTADEFAEQHPAFRDELLEILPSVVSMETLGSEMREQADVRPVLPESLGEFRIVREIGRGGMGTVCEAVQESLYRRVAIKILSPAWSGDDRFRQRFEEESRIIARLRHTNIVEVYGAGQDKGFSYFVMELVDATPLENFMPGIPRDRAVAEIGRQAATALAYAHSNHVLHRDVKPANLLLDRNGVVHISDFGLATALDDVGLELAVSRSQAGTMRYMAPERLDGEPGAASDQYSFGLTLHELLCGRPAFGETNPGKLVKLIGDGKFQPLENVDTDLATIIGKCTALEPADRYVGMDAVATDLGRYLNHEPILARPVPLARRLRLWAKRRPMVAALLLLAVILFTAFNGAVTVGYLKVKSALGQAETNAEIAGQTLARVFGHFSPLPAAEEVAPVSAMNAKMLEALIPFYEQLSQQTGLDEATLLKMADASRILGLIHLRTGKPEQATAAFDRAYGQYAKIAQTEAEQASCLNYKAAALQFAGHDAEAKRVWQQVVNTRTNSPAPACRYEAVVALKSMAATRRRMPGMDKGKEPVKGEIDQQLITALDLLVPLLEADPGNAEYRFTLATLLSQNPKLGRSLRGTELDDDEQTILAKLVEDYPNQPRYRLELARSLTKMNLRDGVSEEQMLRLRDGIGHCDRLLAQWPNEPEVIIAAADIRHKYSAALFSSDQKEAAIRELDRAIGILSILTNNPDVQPDSLLRLMALKVKQADMLCAMQRTDETRTLLSELKTETIRLQSLEQTRHAEEYASILERIGKLERKLERRPRADQ